VGGDAFDWHAGFFWGTMHCDGTININRLFDARFSTNAVGRYNDMASESNEVYAKL
jgi:hypothetical protein